MTERAVVAAFDLDGTLSKHDTLVPFLRRAVGTGRTTMCLVRNAVWFARAKRDRALRDAAKEALLVTAVAGRVEAELREIGTSFAPTISWRDEMIEVLRGHQRVGHETVVVSASPTLYVDAVARHLGIDAVVATQLEVVDGLLTGRYVGENCRAEEKARRLQAWLGGRDVELHAYGNPPDDDAMLSLADVPVRV